MTKNELEIRLKIAEKAINDALLALSKENITKIAKSEEFKDNPMNLAMAYASACGHAQASLDNYKDKCKDIEEHGVEFVKDYILR